MKLRWVLICWSACAALGIGIACTSSTGSTGPSSGQVKQIVISPDSASVSAHATQNFSASAVDGAGATVNGVTFTWSSNNTNVATINQSGHASTVDTGHVQIAASAQGISGFATLVVGPAPVGSIIIAPAVDTLAIGAQTQLSDTVKDAYGNVLNMPVTWTSSNSGVAFVSSSGQVLGRGAGTASVTATAGGKTGTNSTVVIDTTAPENITLALSPDSVVAIPNPLDVLIQVTATVHTITGRVLSSYPVVFTSTDPPVSGFLGAGADTVVGGSILIAPDANGHAVITATAGTVTAQATLTVCYQATPPICNPLDSIRVQPPVDTLTVGDSTQLEAIGIDSLGNAYPNMFVEWDPGTVVASDSSRVFVIGDNGELHALNVGSQDVLADITGFVGQGIVTVLPAAPAASLASGPAYEARRARLIASVGLARRQALEARNRRHQEVRQLIAAAMRGTKSPSTLRFYSRALARLDAARTTPNAK